jgi:1-Cys peroxiredoxin 6
MIAAPYSIGGAYGGLGTYGSGYAGGLSTIGGAYTGGLSTYSSGYTPAMPYGGALGSSMPIFSARSSVPQRAQPIAMAGSSFVPMPPASAYRTIIQAAPAQARGTASASVNNPLRIGATSPNFFVQTTKGDFDLHDFLLGDETKPWTIMFSHPNDFTPVCTTELGACHSLSGRFAGKGAKLIGISCNTVDSHVAWEQDVLHREGKSADGELAFPIIADIDRSLVYKLGMLDPEERDSADLPLPARALVILNGTTVKLTILYPATTGRNFEEIFRVLTSMQLTANNGLATPVNWKYGERVIVGPKVKTEDAKAKFKDFQQEELPSGKPYLRSVADPSK